MYMTVMLRMSSLLSVSVFDWFLLLLLSVNGLAVTFTVCVIFPVWFLIESVRSPILNVSE